LYRGAGGFIYPSLYEGFGMPPIEAMACGTPVICSARGSLGEVVGDAALIIDPESEDNIAEAMGQLSNSPDCFVKLQKAGFVNARRFDWRQTALHTLAIYERAADRYNRRAN
jgi:glycosyltransferase involved in cell wall biosynthesis